MKLYIVLVEDRHADADVVVFSNKEAAISYARKTAKEYARREGDYEEQELSPAMLEGRWVFYAIYSVEDDSVRVLERELDDAKLA